MTPAPSITVQGLSKHYPTGKKGVVVALDGIDFAIGQGEVVAFLGPNGAGKSTTIKILCGILAPSAGAATILDAPAGTRAAAGHLGMVFGTRSQLYMHMRVAQSLDLVAEIYGLTGAEKTRRIGAFAERFEIQKFLAQRARSLSLGERMRCELVAAMLHEPRVLLADEPTIGLDVVAKNQLRRLVKEWQATSRTTLMLTSHDLADVEALCDRCILIDQGRIRFDGDMTSVKGELAWTRRVLVTVRDLNQAHFSGQAPLKSLPDEAAGYGHRYELDTRELPMHEAVGLVMRHYGEALQDVRIEAVSLEEVLHRLYVKDGRPGDGRPGGAR